jgi:hypothetical protein
MFTDLGDITVRMIQRNEDAFLPPFDDIELQAGRLIIIAATRKKLTELLSSRRNSSKASCARRARRICPHAASAWR